MVQAVAGPALVDYLNSIDKVIKRLGAQFKTKAEDIPARVAALTDELKSVQKQLAEAQSQAALAKVSPTTGCSFWMQLQDATSARISTMANICSCKVLCARLPVQPRVSFKQDWSIQYFADMESLMSLFASCTFHDWPCAFRCSLHQQDPSDSYASICRYAAAVQNNLTGCSCLGLDKEPTRSCKGSCIIIVDGHWFMTTFKCAI